MTMQSVLKRMQRVHCFKKLIAFGCASGSTLRDSDCERVNSLDHKRKNNLRQPGERSARLESLYRDANSPISANEPANLAGYPLMRNSVHPLRFWPLLSVKNRNRVRVSGDASRGPMG